VQVVTNENTRFVFSVDAHNMQYVDLKQYVFYG